MKPAIISGHGPGPRVVTSHRFSKLYIDGSGWKSIHAASGQRLSSNRSRAATRTFSLSGNSTMQHEKAMIAETSASASRSGRSRFAATNSKIGSVTGDAIHGRASHVTRLRLVAGGRGGARVSLDQHHPRHDAEPAPEPRKLRQRNEPIEGENREQEAEAVIEGAERRHDVDNPLRDGRVGDGRAEVSPSPHAPSSSRRCTRRQLGRSPSFGPRNA